MPQTVRAVSLTGFIEVAASLGLDPYEMLRERSIAPETLAEPEARIEAAAALTLLEEAARLSGRDDLSVMMVGYRSFGSLGPLSLLLQHLENPREVVAALVKYRSLLNDLIVLHTEMVDGTMLLKVGILNERAGFQAVGMAVAVLHLVLSEVSGGQWAPESVHFTHPRSTTVGAFERLFRAPVVFSSAFDGFSCTSHSLEIPNKLADKARAEHAERLLLDSRMAVVRSDPESMTANEVAELLGTGRATLPNVATLLGLSGRGLQRMLEARGSSFGEVLNATRGQIACRYVTDSTLPLSIVAELVGYASSATFGRWFANQFGEPPIVRRQRHQKQAVGQVATAKKLA